MNGFSSDCMRFDSESTIREALRLLMRKGIGREELEETLVTCGPVDLDLLADVMRRFDPAHETARGGDNGPDTSAEAA